MIIRTVLLMLTAMVLTACGASVVKTEPPVQPASKVLVMTGPGMVARSSEDARYEETWLRVASRYAVAVNAALNDAGLNAQLHIKKDRTEGPDAVLARLVREEKKDALIQVTVSHIRNSRENTIYLEAQYMPLAYQHLSDGGRRVVPQTGPEQRYPLLSTTGKDMREASISGLAEEFVQELRAQGYFEK